MGETNMSMVAAVVSHGEGHQRPQVEPQPPPKKERGRGRITLFSPDFECSPRIDHSPGQVFICMLLFKLRILPSLETEDDIDSVSRTQKGDARRQHATKWLLVLIIAGKTILWDRCCASTLGGGGAREEQGSGGLGWGMIFSKGGLPVQALHPSPCTMHPTKP